MVEFKQLSPTVFKVLVDGKPVADYYSRTGVVCLLVPISEQSQAAVNDAIKAKQWKLEKSVPPPPNIPEDMKE